MLRFGAVLLALIVLAGCGGDLAAEAAPAVAWSSSVGLSTGVELSAPAIGAASSGAALALFAQSDSYSAQTRNVFLATASAGQPFGKATLLAAGASSPRVAVLPAGRAVLTYSRELTASRREAMIARGNVDGTFGPATSLGQSDAPTALAAAPDGRTLAVTSGYRAKHFYVDVRLIAPDGRLGTPRRLGDVGLSAAGSLAVGPDGTVALVYTDPRSAHGQVRAAVLAPGQKLRVGTVMSGGFAAPQIAVGPAGRLAVVATKVRATGEDASYGGVVVAERKPGAARFDGPKHVPVTPRSRPYAFGPTVAFDAAGHRVVAWVQDAKPSDTDGEAEDARGASWSWTGGRPARLDPSTREITLTGTNQGVLAITDTGPWQAFWVRPDGAHRTSAPQGRASDYATSADTDRSLLATPARIVFGFVGLRPQQINLATATTHP